MTSMLDGTRVTSQIDDDFLRRLIHGIEEMADGWSESVGQFGPTAGNVEACLDGDHFLAYQEARAMMADAYPDLYTEDEE